MMLPFREKPGVISRDGCWVWFANGRMFTGNTLLRLMLDIIRGWRDDRWIVG